MPKTELELKFRCEDLKAVKEKAEDMGFKFSNEEKQRDTYFIVNKWMANGSRHFFRLREDLDSGKAVLNYNKVMSDVETEEIDVGVSDAEHAKLIVEELGFNEVCIVEKDREEYSDGRFTIVLDKVKDLGDFVEVELNEDYSVENEKKLKELAGKLGFKVFNAVRFGYPTILLNS